MIYRNIFLLPPLMAASAICQSSQGGLSAQEAASLRAQYGQLNEQTFILHGNPKLGRLLEEDPGRVPVVRKELLGILRKAIIQVLSSPRATEEQVRDTINRVQGDFAFGPWAGDSNNTPFAHFFSLNGYQSLAVAYAIMEGGEGIPDSQSFLDFYVRRNDEWKLRTVAGSDFRSSTFSVYAIPAGLVGESWFLACGHHFGDSGGRLTLRLYAFDGDEARVIWKRDELSHGDVEVSGNTVKLNYWKNWQDYGSFTEESLHVTPNGLQ